MKIRFKDLPVGSCFSGATRGRESESFDQKVRKKIGDSKVVIVRPDGRVSKRTLRGNPEVELQPCPLRYLGLGLRRHPEQVVEIGDGNLLKNQKRRNRS
jgi:hypothetical protein